MTQLSLDLSPSPASKLDRDSLRGRVQAFFEIRGGLGATDDEVQAALEIDGNTERPRRRELEEGGYLVRTDERRETRSGGMARVYRATGA